MLTYNVTDKTKRQWTYNLYLNIDNKSQTIFLIEIYYDYQLL